MNVCVIYQIRWGQDGDIFVLDGDFLILEARRSVPNTPEVGTDAVEAIKVW